MDNGKELTVGIETLLVVILLVLLVIFIAKRV